MNIRFVLVPTILLFCLMTNAIAAESQSLTDIRSQLQKDFPRLPAGEMTATPVAGMYAVTTGLDIVYYFPASGHLINGNLYSKTGENLTQKAVDDLMTTAVAGLPLDKAVKIGNGPIQVVEVTDPDCPYCRKASAFFEGKDALVTRYVFFMPLPMHPNAPAKAAWILAAKDGAAAYHEIMAGKYDKTPLPEYTDNGLLAEHKAIAAKLGVRGTPQFFLKGQHVGGANIPELSKLIGVAPPTPNIPAKPGLRTGPAQRK
jgi:thiol:disulfide interchange protein DsbC